MEVIDKIVLYSNNCLYYRSRNYTPCFTFVAGKQIGDMEIGDLISRAGE